jgi:hypothetical protein
VIQNIRPQSVDIEIGRPKQVSFRVNAIRSVSGKVTIYDTTKLQSVPLANVTVKIEDLKLETKTDANGSYLFRNLSAGTYTIAAISGQSKTTRKITIPSEPTNLRNIDLDVTAK